MFQRKQYRNALIVLIVMMLPIQTWGQRIVRISVDTTLCLADSVRFSIGGSSSDEVLVRGVSARLTHTERVFIPDGVVCEPRGCGFRSTVTYNDFHDTTHIRTVDAIDFVRLKIEHSRIGDLHVSITCPNRQRASLMRWSGTGTAGYCATTIDAAYQSWAAGTNMRENINMGQANIDNNSSRPCDSSAIGNEAGTGWNYCWSENTTLGYNYAPDDGIIYRATNVHNNRVDSSDVAAGLNFYHPDEGFASLLGCPANGDWTIEVIDASSSENGYVFEWEMALDTMLHPSGCTITEHNVTGSNVRRVNDTLYYGYAPVGATSDTTVRYTIHLGGVGCGHVKDTSINVHYHRYFLTQMHSTICQGDTAWLGGQAFVRDTTILDTLPSLYGCDSIIDVQVVVHGTYDTLDSLTFCPGELITYGGINYGHTTKIDALLRTMYGCDSMIHIRLQLVDSLFALRIQMSENGPWQHDSVLMGCIPFEVRLLDTTPHAAWRHWRLGDSDSVYTDSVMTHIYDSVGEYTLTLVARSVHGCRDSVSWPLAIRTFAHPRAAFDWRREYPGIHNPETQFNNLSQPANCTYLWKIQSLGGEGGYDTTSEVHPFYHWGAPNNPAVAGDYDVQLVAFWTQQSSDGMEIVCTDTADGVVTIVNTFLEFPSLVTPDGDGYNDRWEVLNLVEMGFYPMNEVWIYNPWGSLVYHARDITEHSAFWDPNQTNSPDGTYYFRFSARGSYGVVKRNGTIEVIRKNN